MMGTGAVVLLGLIALASAVQVGFYIWLALTGLRLARWAQETQEDLQSRLAPAQRNLDRVRANVAEVQGIYVREFDRTRAAADRIAGRARDTREALDPVLENVRRVAEVLAFLRSFRD